jgi:hypothetical protein
MPPWPSAKRIAATHRNTRLFRTAVLLISKAPLGRATVGVLPVDTRHTSVELEANDLEAFLVDQVYAH